MFSLMAASLASGPASTEHHQQWISTHCEAHPYSDKKMPVWLKDNLDEAVRTSTF